MSAHLAKTIYRSGRLFVWSSEDKLPLHIKLPENVIKASIGPDHIAAIGESGNLYTFGKGKDGKLGHGEASDLNDPKLVQYFQKHQIVVKDAVCGQRHTIVLSDKGEVYTFGFGKKKTNILMKLLTNTVGPLGHGTDIAQVVSKPLKVKSLEGQVIQRITAGRHFNIVFNQSGEVYNWGNGEYAAFGDGNNKNFDIPHKNEHFEYLKKQEHLEVTKVKSCESFSVALMKNGKLYGWGSNEHGQMGIKAEIGLEMFQTVNFVSEVIREGYENQRVVNFDISQNTLLFQLENDEVWWTGMKIAYKPEKLQIGVVPKLFAAGSRCSAIVDNQNQLYVTNDFVKGSKDDTVKVQTGIGKMDGGVVFGGEILAIGGEYSKRYAIVA